MGRSIATTRRLDAGEVPAAQVSEQEIVDGAEAQDVVVAVAEVDPNRRKSWTLSSTLSCVRPTLLLLG